MHLFVKLYVFICSSMLASVHLYAVLYVTYLQIPYVISNAIIEWGVKDSPAPAEEDTHTQIQQARTDVTPRATDSDIGQLNMAYYLSWYCGMMTFGLSTLFWVDILPKFGTSSDLSEFAEK